MVNRTTLGTGVWTLDAAAVLLASNLRKPVRSPFSSFEGSALLNHTEPFALRVLSHPTLGSCQESRTHTSYEALYTPFQPHSPDLMFSTLAPTWPLCVRRQYLQPKPHLRPTDFREKGCEGPRMVRVFWGHVTRVLLFVCSDRLRTSSLALTFK